MCCQKLVIAQKYSAEVRLNFGTRLAPSAKHYNGMFGAPFHTILCLKKTRTATINMT